MNISLLGGWLDKIINFILGFFAFIPQLIYFLYASVASLLDVLQYLIRKLAGLDVYYVNGEPQQNSDIISQFLRGILGIDADPAYSTVSTIFWSFVIFGVILLVLTTIISIIKAHYNYDANKSHPLKIFYGSLKSLALMAIVPIVSIFGVYLAQILLQTLDRITTSGSSGAIESVFDEVKVGEDENGNPIMSSVAYENFVSGVDSTGYQTYTSYDYFSFGDYTSTSTFSGMLFNIAGHDCNRVRLGEFRVQTSADQGNWDTMGVFYTNDESNPQETLAQQIDFAFVNNLHLKHSRTISVSGDDASVLGPSFAWGFSATVGAQLINVGSFSKFNVGAVFYYYNLWAFNYLLGFTGVIMCITLLGNIIFGLMTRLLQVVALFLVFPALVGIMPLDEGSGFASWRKQFISDILMAFGAVVGLNIFFSILPFFQTISFFNISFIDGIVNMVIVLAGLALVKKFIGLTSKFVGGGDANETGQSVSQDVKGAALKGLVGTAAAGAVGVAAFTPMMAGMKMGAKGVGKVVGKVGSKIGTKIADKVTHTTQQERQDNKIRKTLGLGADAKVEEDDYKAYQNFRSLDRKERKAVLKYAQHQGYLGVARKDTMRREFNVEEGSQVAPEALKQYRLKAIDKNTKKVERRYKHAKVMSVLTGQDPDKVKKGIVDEKGNITDEGTGGAVRAFGTAFVDFGQVALKSIGQITGASSAWKQLGDAGAVDYAKQALKRSAQSVGLTTLAQSKMATTKGEKDKADEEALKSLRKSQEASLQALASNTEKVSQQIQQLASILSASRSRGGGGTPPAGS